MSPRPIDEPHRVSSPLELLFDLTFVVAVAAVTTHLAHSVADGHGLAGLVPFLQVFFAVWWAWMNFTWFASAYDTDDVPYRLLTMVQMAGVLVLAAGVPAAADHSDYRIVTLGYLVMRIGLVSQWLRAAAEDPARRSTALRYATGITVLQVGWVLYLVVSGTDALPSLTQVPFFAGLAVLELAVPRWAERTTATSWHPHHIAERYGLFTIILLGESVLAASRGVTGALEAAEISIRLVVVAVSGLVLLFAFWWLYFLAPVGAGLDDRRHRSYLWGYGHYGIFAALAALGAGLEVTVEWTGHDVRASGQAVCYAIAIPAAVLLLLLWLVNAPITAEPVVDPAAVLGGVSVILVLPLATARLGVAAVVAAIAAVNVLLIISAFAGKSRRSRRGGGRRRSYLSQKR
ncbi:MAG TPA: low temperature requirement protein A [Actinoallomurus sp.]|nr:low temperature requirement protein A [Actinoallomurus sp.]